MGGKRRKGHNVSKRSEKSGVWTDEQEGYAAVKQLFAVRGGFCARGKGRDKGGGEGARKRGKRRPRSTGTAS